MTQNSVPEPARASRTVDDAFTDAGLLGAEAPVAKRPNRRGEQTRAKIVQAATECFSEYGYTRTRISDITHRADISQGNFYRHFSSLDDVFLAVLRPGLAELADAMSRRLSNEDEMTVLVDVNVAYLHAYSRHRKVLRLLREAAAASANEGFAQLWLNIRGDFVKRIQRWLQRLQDNGRIGEADTVLLAETLGCMTEQMAYIHVGLVNATPRRERIDELGKAIGEVWFRALPLVHDDRASLS
ncbi:TetR/AcrR family transcriptional regulator [Nocardia nova]|uniref:TetR/AcrR family transcriptional regulator n=1 Tax=Nocardia nova TaxID=37330 RepID=UPI000CEA6DE1|nr:TetR/AcrR family transcriptional regulator [Nocardia nova]PPJ24928.1 TetR/AcrR family transcriptional regulator [Nocardia nova]